MSNTSVNLLRAPNHALKFHRCSTSLIIPHSCFLSLPPPRHIRRLATVHTTPKVLPDVWFSDSAPGLRPSSAGGDHKPPDERTLKLGKTLRILQARLPTLLQSPLPTSILSPQISLHLFPSTHPHLPTVTGRVAYVAALWTSPIAWGRFPIVGNVKLEILSERMVKKSSSDSPLHYIPASSASSSGYRSEQLVVRWKTCGKKKGNGGSNGNGLAAATSDPLGKVSEAIMGGKTTDDNKEFTGLFIFEFDEEGRIVTHIIEHAQEGGNWEKGVGARVVGLTDWLLGGIRGKGEADPTPTPVCCGSWGKR